MINLSRRKLLTGLGATLITAPAIVRVASLMPVKAYPAINMRMILEYNPAGDYDLIIWSDDLIIWSPIVIRPEWMVILK